MTIKVLRCRFRYSAQAAMAGVLALAFSLVQPAAAQRGAANVYYPPSSIERPQDLGKFAHTNYVLYSPNGGKPVGAPSPPSTAETPDSLACVYGLLSGPAGCPIGTYTHHLAGGFGTIALVDAYDNPNAGSDLTTFANQYLLPSPNFTKVKVDSSHGYSGASCVNVPADTTGWALEEALDIEYAFAMAPKAQIVLVEACSANLTDLLYAELVAGSFAQAGDSTQMPPVLPGGDVSNSWGTSDFAGETSYDTNFFKNCLPSDPVSGHHCTNGYWDRVVYFASAGDDGCGAQWPSSSPWIVSAGGTSIKRTGGPTGPFSSETCWNGSGGGVSSNEIWGGSFPVGMGPWVNFQYAQFGESARQTPDIAADADPNSGAAVYCTYSSCGGPGPWYQVGGTSLASPLLAGIVNIAYNKLGQGPHSGPPPRNTRMNKMHSCIPSCSR